MSTSDTPAGDARRSEAMDVLLFGTTGMLGQGTLRECLLDPGVTR